MAVADVASGRGGVLKDSYGGRRMPFRSEAQRRWMHAAEKRGEVRKGTAARWERETKDKNLPYRAKGAAAAIRRRARGKD